MKVDAVPETVKPSSFVELGTGVRFSIFLALSVIINLLSWPTLFSLDLWVLKDRGSFLNLDYLIDQHLRLGVDTYYCYGLLPVFLQHWLFVLFGRGYWPLLGCAAVSMILISYFCAILLRYLPSGTIWILALLAMDRIINSVNPNLPYSLVQISLLFALFFVLDRRLHLALAAAAVGCWSVPSLPLVMAVSLVALIIVDWYLQRPSALKTLLISLLPGALAYVGIGAVLALQFGWQSVMSTSTPLAGMAFYKQVGYGSNHALMEFLHPPGYSTLHYVIYAVLNPVAWWVASSLILLWFALRASRKIIVHRELEPQSTTIILCAILQIVLAAAAYGAPHQHYIYDPILIVGVLLGISQTTSRSVRQLLMTVFVTLGIVGQASMLRATLKGWQQTRSADTANLYADRGWAGEWKQILALSTQRDLLMLSYSTGVHQYFPSIHSPDVWTIREGQSLPDDQARVNHQIDQADVVVLDMTSPVDFDFLKPGTAISSSFCLTSSTQNFQVWWRRSTVSKGVHCVSSEPATQPITSAQM